MADRFTETIIAENVRDRVIQLIAASQYKAYFACAGGGSGLQRYFALIPGAAGFLVGAVFPYATIETDKFLGFRPEHYVSRENAINLAHASYLRAMEHLTAEQRSGREITKKALGLGLTAAVATSRVLKGGYRCHLAVTTPDGTWISHVELPNEHGEGGRLQHAAITDVLGIDALCQVTGLYQVGSPPLVMEKVSEEELRGIFFKNPVFMPFGTRGTLKPESAKELAFLCGSFNPMHDGHRKMAEATMQSANVQVMYSTTADSLHKPPLTVSQMLDRAAGVRVDHWDGYNVPIVFSQHDPLFIDKARLLPGSNFIIGVDTFDRMLDPKWYGDGQEGVESMLDEMQGLEIEFMVFGRIINGKLEEPDFSKLAARYQFTFHKMDGAWGFSSTAIREAAKNG